MTFFWLFWLFIIKLTRVALLRSNVEHLKGWVWAPNWECRTEIVRLRALNRPYLGRPNFEMPWSSNIILGPFHFTPNPRGSLFWSFWDPYLFLDHLSGSLLCITFSIDYNCNIDIRQSSSLFWTNLVSSASKTSHLFSFSNRIANYPFHISVIYTLLRSHLRDS